jgi:hypothetical protein
MHNFTFLGGSLHAAVYFGFLGQEKYISAQNQIEQDKLHSCVFIKTILASFLTLGRDFSI